MNLPPLPADPIVGPLPHTPEWHALRRYDETRAAPVVLGATTAGPVTGMSNHSSALEVYMRQLGMLEDPIVTEGMENGTDIEPIACKRFAKRRSVELVCATHGIKIPMYFSRQWPWMAATPDDLALFDVIEGVEAKATTFRRYDEYGINDDAFGEVGTDQLPIDYIMQGQQQIAVLGVPAVNYPVFFDIHTLRIYRVERNEDLIASIIECGKEMVERIVNRDPPEPNYHSSKAAKLIRELHGLELGKTITFTADQMQLYTKFCHTKLQLKNLEEEKESLKAMLLQQMADAQIALFPQGTKQLKRTVIADSLWTIDDVRKAEECLGQVKKKGHERLTESKVK